MSGIVVTQQSNGITVSVGPAGITVKRDLVGVNDANLAIAAAELATSKAASAATSETNAAASETNAAASAAAAATSEASAATHDTNAAASAAAAATSETNAAASETNAAASAAAAATSEASAATHDTNAAASAAAAATSEANAAASAASMNLGGANGVATLDGNGKLDPSQIPSISITDTFTVASESAMLALTAQKGDVAVRTDISKTFILADDDPTNVDNWVQIITPGDSGSFATLTISGNVSVGGGLAVTGTITGNLTGDVTGDVDGNAATATKLATARNIAGVSFDGSEDIDIGVGGLSDVDTSTTAPSDGDVLRYNESSEKWEPKTPPGIFTKFSESGELTFSSLDEVFYGHGLGVTPKLVVVALRCKTAEQNYSPGDEISTLPCVDDDPANPNVRTFTIAANSINVKVRVPNGIKVSKLNAGDAVDITLSNWRMIIRAWA